MLLKFFFINFCDSGPDMFSKELQNKLLSKPLSLCKWMFCLPNFLVRKSTKKGINELICKILYRLTTHGLIKFRIFFHTLSLLQVKVFPEYYIVFISFSSMIVTDWAFSMAFVTSSVDVDGQNFIKEFLLLFLIALNHCITDMVYCHWFTGFFSLILMLTSSR